MYDAYLQYLADNSAERIAANKNYQLFLKKMKEVDFDSDEPELFGLNDLQLTEAYNIMNSNCW